MANWIVGGIVFLLLGVIVCHIINTHKKSECCGYCKNCSGCKNIKSFISNQNNK